MQKYPTINFVDTNGIVLKFGDDGIQHVQQFRQPWKVRLSGEWIGKVGLTGNANLYLSNIPETYDWQLPSGYISKGVRGSAGVITVVLIDSDGNSIESSKAKLAVEPANFTDDQLDRMIADIGRLALAVSSCISREISIPIGESGGLEDIGFQWLPYQGILVTTDALLDLASVIQQNWLTLEKRPLKNIKTDAGRVNRSRIHASPKLLIKAFTEPYRQSFMGMARTETTDCLENQFLCYLLDVYLQDVALGLIKSLESITIDNVQDQLIPDDRRRNDDSFRKFRGNVQKKVKLRNLRLAELQHSISTKIDKLKKCVEWVKYARSSLLLRNIATPATIPTPSLRLIGSPTYGAIYACFSATQGHVLEKLQNVLYLFEYIHRGFVRPVWEIYEIWCFVSIYSAFVLYGGMYPVRSGNLFEGLRVAMGDIQLPKNQPFQLVRTLSDGRELKVILTYEPLKYNSHHELRTPDIFVEISIAGSSPQKFGFDAKYRSYADQGYEQFTKDVLETAKDRYKQQLGLRACFILHSDKNFDYWGEVQFSRFLKEKFERGSQGNDYVGHTFGAIALLPDSSLEQQLKKIIHLLLQYHQNESLATTCIPCGYHLKLTEDVCASWKPDRISEGELIRRVIADDSRSGRGTGVYCGCPKCGDFWVVHSCYGDHHHLLKSSNHFHRNSDHPEFKGKWMFICPVCGSDPSAAELKAKRGGYESENHNFSYETDDYDDF
jgi:PD-(D/E)XK nuclease superfamily